MRRRPDRPPKVPNLKKTIFECLESRRFYFTLHVIERQRERRVTQMDILHVLRHGRRETAKDKYDEDFGDWKYAVRGRTVDKRMLRIVVAFDPPDLLVVTVIDLDDEIEAKHGTKN